MVVNWMQQIQERFEINLTHEASKENVQLNQAPLTPQKKLLNFKKSKAE